MARVHVQVNMGTRVPTVTMPLTDRGKARPFQPRTWQVVVELCEGMASDGMWVRLTHAAKFTDYAAAEQLARKVEAKLKGYAWEDERLAALNLEHWTWSHGTTNVFASLQPASKAKEYTVAY